MRVRECEWPPSLVVEWLSAQLEERGIPGSIYAHAVLSLLHSYYCTHPPIASSKAPSDLTSPLTALSPGLIQHSLAGLSKGGKSHTLQLQELEELLHDLAHPDADVPITLPCSPATQVCRVTRRAQKRQKVLQKQRLYTPEQLQKLAVLQCLMSASDEHAGLEDLVEELCTRLKVAHGGTEQDAAIDTHGNSSGTADPGNDQDLNRNLLPHPAPDLRTAAATHLGSDTTSQHSSSAGSPDHVNKRYYTTFPALTEGSTSNDREEITQQVSTWNCSIHSNAPSVSTSNNAPRNCASPHSSMDVNIGDVSSQINCSQCSMDQDRMFTLMDTDKAVHEQETVSESRSWTMSVYEELSNSQKESSIVQLELPRATSTDSTNWASCAPGVGMLEDPSDGYSGDVSSRESSQDRGDVTVTPNIWEEWACASTLFHLPVAEVGKKGRLFERQPVGSKLGQRPSCHTIQGNGGHNQTMSLWDPDVEHTLKTSPFTVGSAERRKMVLFQDELQSSAFQMMCNAINNQCNNSIDSTLFPDEICDNSMTKLQFDNNTNIWADLNANNLAQNKSLNSNENSSYFNIQKEGSTLDADDITKDKAKNELNEAFMKLGLENIWKSSDVSSNNNTTFDDIPFKPGVKGSNPPLDFVEKVCESLDELYRDQQVAGGVGPVDRHAVLHHTEHSGFSSVVPHRNTESTTSSKDELPLSRAGRDDGNEENLLTSPRTHFRPIKCETDYSPPQLPFQRSSSGALYLEQDLIDGSPKKYMIYKEPPPKSLVVNQEEVYCSDAHPGSSAPLVPKFKVVNNEKFCQTEEGDNTASQDKSAQCVNIPVGSFILPVRAGVRLDHDRDRPTHEHDDESDDVFSFQDQDFPNATQLRKIWKNTDSPTLPKFWKAISPDSTAVVWQSNSPQSKFWKSSLPADQTLWEASNNEAVTNPWKDASVTAGKTSEDIKQVWKDSKNCEGNLSTGSLGQIIPESTISSIWAAGGATETLTPTTAALSSVKSLWDDEVQLRGEGSRFQHKFWLDAREKLSDWSVDSKDVQPPDWSKKALADQKWSGRNIDWSVSGLSGGVEWSTADAATSKGGEWSTTWSGITDKSHAWPADNPNKNKTWLTQPATEKGSVMNMGSYNNTSTGSSVWAPTEDSDVHSWCKQEGREENMDAAAFPGTEASHKLGEFPRFHIHGWEKSPESSTLQANSRYEGSDELPNQLLLHEVNQEADDLLGTLDQYSNPGVGGELQLEDLEEVEPGWQLPEGFEWDGAIAYQQQVNYADDGGDSDEENSEVFVYKTDDGSTVTLPVAYLDDSLYDQFFGCDPPLTGSLPDLPHPEAGLKAIKGHWATSGRRPCTYFMEGSCKRKHCKFSHDLASITCRFWQEGSCFKGTSCPFLHGYGLHRRRNRSEGTKSDGDKPLTDSNFELNSEADFPSLSSSVDSKESACEGKGSGSLATQIPLRKKTKYITITASMIQADKSSGRRQRRHTITERSHRSEHQRSRKQRQSVPDHHDGTLSDY